jgi:hypothetical protein
MKRVLLGLLLNILIYIAAMAVCFGLAFLFGGEAPLGMGYVLIFTLRYYLPISLIIAGIVAFKVNIKCSAIVSCVYWLVFILLCLLGLSIGNLSFLAHGFSLAALFMLF